MQTNIIIIPCYNEEKRLQINEFIKFASEHTYIHYIFVNDGSTDNTQSILEQIQEQVSSTEVINLSKNSGKGNALRNGFIAAINKGAEYIGYLDADLSTSLKEYERLCNTAIKNDYDMVIGSRIKKIDTIIQRSFFRHIIGRIIATIIDWKYNLGVYDTQCGAKIFKSAIVSKFIETPFQTKWFFDVEILCRVNHFQKNCKSAEIPLNIWVNKYNSKLNILSFPSVLKDLITLFNKY